MDDFYDADKYQLISAWLDLVLVVSLWVGYSLAILTGWFREFSWIDSSLLCLVSHPLAEEPRFVSTSGQITKRKRAEA